MWVFSYLDMSTALILEIRRMLGQYLPLSTYHLPYAPIHTVPIPNLPVIVAEKGLESLSSPLSLGGNEKLHLFN
jgi:hypothetical protein